MSESEQGTQESKTGTEWTVTVGTVTLSFQTDSCLFSPSRADRGTLAMLSELSLTEQDQLLDLGCGYGLVGIWAAKQIGAERVVMCDIQEEAVTAARRNMERNGLSGIRILTSDGLEAVTEREFTLILSNPPYHENFSVPKRFIEQGYHALATGGRMIMVTKRRDWYYNKLKAVFGGVAVREIDGYYVFTAEKRGMPKREKKKNEQIPSKKLRRKIKRNDDVNGNQKSAVRKDNYGKN